MSIETASTPRSGATSLPGCWRSPRGSRPRLPVKRVPPAGAAAARIRTSTRKNAARAHPGPGDSWPCGKRGCRTSTAGCKRMNDDLSALGKIIRAVHGPLAFTVLEIGARPLAEQRESFHQLLDVFPGSQILAFEIEEKLCRELNERARPGLKYFPVALGCKEETRALYETVHPMCTSL